MSARLKSASFLGLAVLVSALAGASATVWLRPLMLTTTVSPGTEIASMLGEYVMSVIYTTPTFTLTAQRSRPGADFAVQLTFAGDDKPQQCMSTPDLAGQLSYLTTIRAKSPLKTGVLEQGFPFRVGTLTLTDQMTSEPPITLQLQRNELGDALAILDQGEVIAIDLQAATLAQLAKGCSVLAKR